MGTHTFLHRNFHVCSLYPIINLSPYIRCLWRKTLLTFIFINWIFTCSESVEFCRGTRLNHHLRLSVGLVGCDRCVSGLVALLPLPSRKLFRNCPSFEHYFKKKKNFTLVFGLFAHFFSAFLFFPLRSKGLTDKLAYIDGLYTKAIIVDDVVQDVNLKDVDERLGTIADL